MVIVKASKESEAGILPDQKILTEMGKYNEELAKAGVLLAAEGLQASSKGARVKFEGDKRTVVRCELESLCDIAQQPSHNSQPKGRVKYVNALSEDGVVA